MSNQTVRAPRARPAREEEAASVRVYTMSKQTVRGSGVRPWREVKVGKASKKTK
jgi:hypothetical protein